MVILCQVNCVPIQNKVANANTPPAQQWVWVAMVVFLTLTFFMNFCKQTHLETCLWATSLAYSISSLVFYSFHPYHEWIWMLTKATHSRRCNSEQSFDVCESLWFANSFPFQLDSTWSQIVIFITIKIHWIYIGWWLACLLDLNANYAPHKRAIRAPGPLIIAVNFANNV